MPNHLESWTWLDGFEATMISDQVFSWIVKSCIIDILDSPGLQARRTLLAILSTRSPALIPLTRTIPITSLVFRRGPLPPLPWIIPRTTSLPTHRASAPPRHNGMPGRWPRPTLSACYVTLLPLPPPVYTHRRLRCLFQRAFNLGYLCAR